MPTFAPAYDPRQRYLSLGSPGRMPAFHPSANYAVSTLRAHPAMISRRRRMALAGYDPRARYLTGLGQDNGGGYTPSPNVAPILPTFQPQDVTPPDIPLAMPTAPFPAGTYGSVVAPGTSVAVAPSGAMVINIPRPGGPASPSWFSATNSLLGISNGMLLMGVGGVALLAMLSSGRRR